MNNGLPTFCLVAAAVASGADTPTDSEHILLKGDAAEVVIAVDGGAIADFHLGDDGLNPVGLEGRGRGSAEPSLARTFSLPGSLGGAVRRGGRKRHALSR